MAFQDDFTLTQQVKLRLKQYHMDNNEIVFDYPDEDPQIEMLISNALESIRQVRHYPDDWDEDKIKDDLKNYRNTVINLVIYDYNKEGMDYENSHTESGVSRQFQSRQRLMADVMPFVHIYS